MTIIRGGLSLPRPTAMNMPIPSSVARSGSITSIHRPCCSAIARASSARTSGLRSLAARFGSVRARFAPSPMISRARSAAAVSAARSPSGRDEDQLVEDRRRGLDVIAIDRARVVAALERAAGDQLGGGRGVAIERVGERRDPDGQPTDDATGQPSLHGGGDRARPLSRSMVSVSPRPTASSRSGGDLPGRGHGGGEPLAAELAERDEGLDLAAGAPVEFAEGTVERGFPGHGDGEDIRGHIPRLIGDDADLHGIESSGSASPGFAGHAATAG